MAETKFQAVLMVLDKRLECGCGALAVIVTGKVVANQYNCLEKVDVWCQDCYEKAQEEDE